MSPAPGKSSPAAPPTTAAAEGAHAHHRLGCVGSGTRRHQHGQRPANSLPPSAPISSEAKNKPPRKPPPIETMRRGLSPASSASAPAAGASALKASAARRARPTAPPARSSPGRRPQPAERRPRARGRDGAGQQGSRVTPAHQHDADSAASPPIARASGRHPVRHGRGRHRSPPGRVPACRARATSTAPTSAGDHREQRGDPVGADHQFEGVEGAGQRGIEGGADGARGAGPDQDAQVAPPHRERAPSREAMPPPTWV